MDREYFADYEDGSEAFLMNEAYDDTKPEGWREGWNDSYELQSRSYSQTRLTHKV